MKQIEGQMDIFMLMNMMPSPITSPVTSPVITPEVTDINLQAGQIIYSVNKGEVDIYVVEDPFSSWEVNDDRGYLLRKMCNGNPGGYGYAYNSKLGITQFTEMSRAKEVAEEYLRIHPDIIRLEDKDPLSVEAYYFIRDIDGRKMMAYLCDFGEDRYYIKNFYTYDHMCVGKNGIKAKKSFYKQIEETKNAVRDQDYIPMFLPMYKTQDSDWDYAEAGYGNAIG